ncbi:unnamed protein product [Miscanthus lutarioriparius]|uniref:Uncharacterized protein n=1 Tax=Miscanthus lutarioriparius TaxID=422564 RepID=A0A811Q2K7_9POAL|nr:unnamed protein product [Miscanthus lutarioriparius]
MFCLVLLDNSCDESQLSFDKDDFRSLNLLIIKCYKIRNINFNSGSCPNLEKIIWFYNECGFLDEIQISGMDNIGKLKELELNDARIGCGFSHCWPEVAVNLPRIRHYAYIDSVLIFYKEGFEHLKCLLIHGHNMTDINFEKGTAVALEKIALSSTNIKSLRGVGQLPMLKELELKGNELFDSFSGEAAPQESTEPEEFQHLKYFHFEDTRMIHIIFENGAAPELEKIILYMSSTESKLTVSGSLPKLKETEVKGDQSIFLSLLKNAGKINKVTLCDTLFNKRDNLYKLLSEKPSIRCLELLDNSYDENQLTFDEDEFGNLNLLIIKCSKIRNINFNSGSCPGLEKIIWYYNKSDPQISGMHNIGNLKELELNGDDVPLQLEKDIKAHKNKPVLRYEEPQHKEDKAHENEQGAASCFPHFTTSYFSKKDQH